MGDYTITDDQIAALVAWAPRTAHDRYAWAKDLANSSEMQAIIRAAQTEATPHRHPVSHTMRWINCARCEREAAS